MPVPLPLPGHQAGAFAYCFDCSNAANWYFMVVQELRSSHNAMGMVNRFTFAILRAELAAFDGDVMCYFPHFFLNNNADSRCSIVPHK